MNTREQGDIGELSAMYWLASIGASGLVKRLDATRCDYLFVLVGDGRRWFIPASAVGGGTAIQLGGPRYAEFEVARGDPIPGSPQPDALSTLDQP
jgi:hypothetical protein